MIFVEIVDFMMHHYNQKLQKQFVFHSLPSIAVTKRSELVDDSCTCKWSM